MSNSHELAGPKEQVICPYCAKVIADHDESDRDHIVPATLGYTTTIKTHKKCNNDLGATVDPILTSQSLVRLLHAEQMGGTLPSLGDRCRAFVQVDEGDILGSIYCDDRRQIRFNPASHQDDGRKWLSERNLRASRHPSLRVLLDDEIQYVGILIEPPTEAELAEYRRVCAKIILGYLHLYGCTRSFMPSDTNDLRRAMQGTGTLYVCEPVARNNALWFCGEEKAGFGNFKTAIGKIEEQPHRAMIALQTDWPFQASILIPGFEFALRYVPTNPSLQFAGWAVGFLL